MPLHARVSKHASKRRGSRTIRTLSLVGLSVALQAHAATAQTLLAPPDTAPDVGKYTTLEECVAATYRMSEQLTRHERVGVWKDTLSWNVKELSAPLPEPLITTAQRCSARYKAATVPLSGFSLLLPLYLVANRDADVAKLLSRRLAAIASRSGASKSGATSAASIDGERIAVLDSAFQAYMQAKPSRLSAAESLTTAFDRSIPRPMTAKPAREVMGMYLALALKDQTLDDTIGMRKFATRTIALLDSLAPAERSIVREQMGENTGYDLFAYSAQIAKAGIGVLLDSLRASTAAYVALQAKLWVDATGERPEASGFPVGRKAPQLIGTVSGHAGDGGPRPVPGKINLVVFIDGECTDVVIKADEELNDPSFCRPITSSLRRFAARFPALEITIVDRTRGYFMYTPPPTPEEEAAYINKALEAHDAPGTTVVGTTGFFRLPAPDRRLVAKKELPNFTQYSFGKSWPSGDGAAFLIDQQGIIILPTGLLTRDSEHLFVGMIEALQARRQASLGAGSPGR